MSPDSIERIKLYVEKNRQASVIAASTCRLNGYVETALRHENEAAFATLILKDLAGEVHA